jgi:hypothetical protein
VTVPGAVAPDSVRKASVWVVLLALVAGLAVPPGAATAVAATSDGPPTIASTFDTDAEGWTIAGDAEPPEHASNGGHPRGHVCGQDNVAGNAWYFAAPERFLGDASAYYGGTLLFALNQSSTSDQFSNHDVVLQNASTTVVYDFGNASAHPRTNWTEYAVPLAADAEGWTDESGDPVTEATFRGVLGNLTALRIRGEYVSGADRGCLDSVRMTADRTPGATVALGDQRVAAGVSVQELVVDSVFLPEGGYVAVYTTPLQEGDLGQTLVGVSSRLGPGLHETLRIGLDSSLTGTQDVVAIPHRDTDDDNTFDSGTTDGVDGPYLNASGDPVTDRASVEGPSPTPTASPGLGVGTALGALVVVGLGVLRRYRREADD